MSVVVIVSPTAQRHYVTIDAWWKKRRKSGAKLFAAEVAAAVELLEGDPAAGVAVPHRRGAHLRRLVLLRSRCLLYYWFGPAEDHVTVVAFWSGSRGRRPPIHLGEVGR